MIQDHCKESDYHKQETEEAYRVPDKSYPCSSFFPGNEHSSLEYCGNNHTGEGEDKDKHDIKDLCNNILLCHIFSSSIVVFELEHVGFDRLSYPQASDSLDRNDQTYEDYVEVKETGSNFPGLGKNPVYYEPFHAH